VRAAPTANAAAPAPTASLPINSRRESIANPLLEKEPTSRFRLLRRHARQTTDDEHRHPTSPDVAVTNINNLPEMS
jgi:hypothetical protein